MQTPASGIIEIASDELKTIDKQHLAKQAKELCHAVAVTDQSFEDGYNLGIQTARVMLNTNITLQMKDIKASDIL